MKGNRILTIDLGASVIKIAEFSLVRGTQLQLDKFVYKDLNIDASKDEDLHPRLVEAIQELIKEHNIKHGRAILSISGKDVFSRFVKLPPVEGSKVREMVIFEAQQNVPFPLDEVVWDYNVLNRNISTDNEVVLVAIKSEIIEKINEDIDSTGLEIEMVDVAPLALYNAARYNYGDPEGSTMVLDIGAHTTNLLFIEGNKLFARTIALAGNAITQAISLEFQVPFLEAERLKREKGFVNLGGAYEEPESEVEARLSKLIRNTMTRLHAEITRTMNLYKTQHGGSTPSRLLLAGGSAILPYTDVFFKEKLGLEVDYFNPFRAVALGQGINPEDLSKSAHFCGETVGLALREVAECPAEVNLLPRSVVSRREFVKKYPYFAGCGAAIIAMILTNWLYISTNNQTYREQIKQYTQYSNELKSKESRINSSKNELREVQGRIDELLVLYETKQYWLKVLNGLTPRMPNEVWFSMWLPDNIGRPMTDIPEIILKEAEKKGTKTEWVEVFNEETGEMEQVMQKTDVVQGASKLPPMATVEASKVSMLEFRGYCVNDPKNSAQMQIVDELKKRLNESEFFSEAQIVNLTTPKETDALFSFVIRVKLKKPINL